MTYLMEFLAGIGLLAICSLAWVLMLASDVDVVDEHEELTK